MPKKPCKTTLPEITDKLCETEKADEVLLLKKEAKNTVITSCCDCTEMCLSDKDLNVINGLLHGELDEIRSIVQDRNRLREFLKKGNLSKVISEISVECDKNRACLNTLESAFYSLEGFLFAAAHNAFAQSPANNCSESCIIRLLLCDEMKDADSMRRKAIQGRRWVEKKLKEIPGGEDLKHVGRGIYKLDQIAACLRQTTLIMLPHDLHILASQIVEAQRFRRIYGNWELERFPVSIRILLRLFDPQKVLIGKSHQEVWFLWNGKENRHREFKVVTTQPIISDPIDLSSHCICASARSMLEV